MAKVDATAFKAAIALAAAQLTAALQDDTLTELAAEFKTPMHALRKIEKLFTLDSATGVFTSDDGYIDQAYAGVPENKGQTPDGVGGVGAATPIALTSAAVEIVTPAQIDLVFDQDITSAESVTVGGTVTTEKTVTGVTIAGNLVTVAVSSDYIAGDVITVSGKFNGVALNQITLSAEAVTNNIV